MQNRMVSAGVSHICTLTHMLAHTDYTYITHAHTLSSYTQITADSLAQGSIWFREKSEMKMTPKKNPVQISGERKLTQLSVFTPRGQNLIQKSATEMVRSHL